MKIGFTGTQRGMSDEQRRVIKSILESYQDFEAHHGDCVGADAEFHDIVKTLGRSVVIHPPINPVKRAFKTGDVVNAPKDYLVRNRMIVDNTDLLICAPRSHEEERRSGTWSTFRYANKQHKKYVIVFPDGERRTDTT